MASTIKIYVDHNLRKEISQMPYRMRKLLEENEHISTFRIYKNLIVLAVSFFLLFSAFGSVQNLLSSLYPKYGFLSLCVIYVMFMISCLTIPPILINKILPWLVRHFFLPILGDTFYELHFIMIVSKPIHIPERSLAYSFISFFRINSLNANLAII